jgi:hypothetical protein
LNFKLHTLPVLLKRSLVLFLLVLSFGYFSGLDMVKKTTDYKVDGIQENILGNEFNEESEALHFKMSERELHGIIHSHVITLSMLFILLQFLIYFTSIPNPIKVFLMIEPMLSLLLTFGGLWMLWNGALWMKYVIMISGICMHLSMVAFILILIYELSLKKA